MSLLKLSWTNTVSSSCDINTQQQQTVLKYSTRHVQNVTVSIHALCREQPLTFQAHPYPTNNIQSKALIV